MSRIVRTVIALVGWGLLVFGVVPVVLAADHAVDISGFAFSPQTVTVKVGDTVTWSNADAQNHTATADDGSFDTGTISSGSPKTVTFATAGTFAYHCKIHPAMTATVVVEAAAGGGSAPPTDTDPVAASTPATPPWAVLFVAALAGLCAAGRRFGRPSPER